MSKLLENLNEKQREAVLQTEGPVLIIAGAGTGKTKTLTHRIAYLLEKGVLPEKILAITFTNKAAKEMRDRTLQLIGQGYSAPNSIKTFHSFGAWILRRHASFFSLPTSFSIIDSSDQLKMIKEIVVEMGFDIKVHNPKIILSIVNKLRNKLSRKKPNSHNPVDVLSVLDTYTRRKIKQGVVDFTDLLELPYRLLKESQEARSLYQNLFSYVHVDEFQDTNLLQNNLVKLLLGAHNNICVVGDSDQTIYTWRGATIKNILEFQEQNPNSKTIFLEQNYRSTEPILQASQAIISKNKKRFEKKLIPQESGGELIEYIHSYSGNSEAGTITRKISELLEEGENPSSIAILFRMNFQSRILEEFCLRKQIPYTVAGTRFFERREIKDIIAYLTFAVNRENLSALARIVNTPKRSIGKVAFAHIASGEIFKMSGKAQLSYKKFLTLLDVAVEKLEKEPISSALTFIIKESGYEQMLRDGGDAELERLGNLAELITYASSFPEAGKETLTSFLESISLMSDTDSSKKTTEGVKLSTVHSSKGLEFKHVFIVGLEQGIFPAKRDGVDDDPEEERRLMYVAMTRAKETLTLSSASTRVIYGKETVQIPSEFLSDIPTELYKEADEAKQEDPGEGLLGTIWI